MPLTRSVNGGWSGTALDGDPVYLVTQIQNFPSQRGSNWSGGNGTHTNRTYDIGTDGRGYWFVKVCRDRSYQSDNCSDWMAYYVD